jgi:hypothetical protein
MKCKCGGKTFTPKKVAPKRVAPKKVAPKKASGSARSKRLSAEATKKATALAKKRAQSASNPYAKGCNCTGK